MKFRVTSITGQEEGRRVSSVTVAMEDRLNEMLAGTDFGSDLTLFVLLFVTAFDIPDENERWASGQTKLGRSRIDEQGQRIRIQSLGVPVERAEVKYLTGRSLADRLTAAAATALSTEPAKIAKELNWQKLRQEILSNLSAAVQGAA